MSVRGRLLLAAGLVVAMTVGAQAAIAAPKGPALNVAYTKDAVGTLAGAEGYVGLLSMAVPAGKYQATVEVTMSTNAGAASFFNDCRLLVGTAVVGSGNGNSLPGSNFVTFPLVAAVTTTATDGISVQCRSGGPVSVSIRVVALSLANIVVIA